ncbi:hypothetical protein E2R60_20415 [Paenibacillus dendritiformis]|uniref:hypothetical protein n=1 Tax=Paenibacillus dendritiformis TaxID=130049 RepID=UPI00105A073A|nr:hypothetical protein [Paenibacillus dendritiformis]TDL50915.1 hypothetical protein E2R60_20415 [Paenibacillus dendritiformis]
MGYTRSEMETTCVYSHDTGKWSVYTCVPAHITRLTKIAGEPTWKEEEPSTNGEMRTIAAKWELDSKQVRFASPNSRQMTEEQKAAAAERMRQLHAEGRL